MVTFDGMLIAPGAKVGCRMMIVVFLMPDFIDNQHIFMTDACQCLRIDINRGG
jgi:hypothetical protein